MSSLFTVDDVFVVGVSFDLLGGYLLGRGLLVSPSQISQRGTTHWGWNSADMIAHIRGVADARLGLCSLAIGFALQAGGYVALIAGEHVAVSALRAVGSVLLAILAAFAWSLVLRRAHTPVVKRLAVSVARADSTTGGLAEFPDYRRLLALGQELGYYLAKDEVPGPGNPGAMDRYARRCFGVEHVTNRPAAEKAWPGPH